MLRCPLAIVLNVNPPMRHSQLLNTVGAWYVVAMVRGSPNPRHWALPARLRKARKKSGITRMALASAAGGGATVSRDIEEGERLPTVAVVARLAAGLGVSAGWLAYGLGEMRAECPAASCEGMGARLQAVRIERGLTKAALARLADLSPSTVADIEKGAQSGVEVMEALAKALAILPAWLAFNEGGRDIPKRRRAAKSATSARV